MIEFSKNVKRLTDENKDRIDNKEVNTDGKRVLDKYTFTNDTNDVSRIKPSVAPMTDVKLNTIITPTVSTGSKKPKYHKLDKIDDFNSLGIDYKNENELIK